MSTEEENKEKDKRSSFDFEKLNDFISENHSFIKNEALSGIFSLGVLVHLVLNTQKRNLNSTPFESKLKGLHITAKDVERIYREALQKINEYHSQYTYKELREFIAEKLSIHNLEIEKMSNQEISFNFVCGLELGRKFKS